MVFGGRFKKALNDTAKTTTGQTTRVCRTYTRVRRHRGVGYTKDIADVVVGMQTGRLPIIFVHVYLFYRFTFRILYENNTFVEYIYTRTTENRRRNPWYVL